MKKTTVYLPDELKRAVERIAAESSRSEADVIRGAIAELARSLQRPRPVGGLFAGDDASLSTGIDRALEGFGDR